MIRVTFVVVVVLLRVFQAAAQERGYLAIDDQGGRHAFSFRGEADAVNMCGTTACEVVASFASCLGVAYSSPTQGQDVWTWMEAATEADARVGALSECQAAGGPACEVLNVYCIDAPAVEAGLGLDQATRGRIQQGLGSAGFDAGMADGLFGPRTRQAIRQWQSSRGAWASGYLTGAQVEALRGAGGLPPQMPAAAPAAAPAASAELESLFWQSVMNSTNPADFEAYLQQFPNGVFRTLAQNRQAALRAAAGGSSSAPAGSRVGGTRIPTSGSRVSGASVPASGGAGFSPDQTCAGKPAGAACWMESAQQPGCYVWNPSLATGASVTWTGECVGGLAQGTGTLTWISDGNPQTGTGRLQLRRPKDRQLGPPLRGRVRPGRPLCPATSATRTGPSRKAPMSTASGTATGSSATRTGPSRKAPMSTASGTATGSSATRTGAARKAPMSTARGTATGSSAWRPGASWISDMSTAKSCRAPRGARRGSISGRYIATPTVARHRLFVWCDVRICPNHQLIVIARDDDTTFGILHSRFHELWSLRLCTWLGKGNDPRYTPSTIFETFPFPAGLTPNAPAADYPGISFQIPTTGDRASLCFPARQRAERAGSGGWSARISSSGRRQR